jgi:hypothetical protein
MPGLDAHEANRYILSMAVADWSGQAWLQGFNDSAAIIFGMSGNELYDLKVWIVPFTGSLQLS